MSDKKSIREFIDNEIHLLWNQYHNYDIDCKLSVKKEFFNNDIIDVYEILKEIVPEEVVQVTTEDSENTNLETITAEQFEVAEGRIPSDRIEIVREVLVTNKPEPVPVVLEHETVGVEESAVVEVDGSAAAEVDESVAVENKGAVTESVVEGSVVEELNNKFIYSILDINEYYIILRSFNNSPVLREIIENKENYIENLFISEIWHDAGTTYFFNDGLEYKWYCKFSPQNQIL
jgi:hypothetical protein